MVEVIDMHREISDAREALQHHSRIGRVRSRFRRRLWSAGIAGAQALKRGVDVTVSAGLLLALFPLFAVVALLIWSNDRGPVIFWQTRVGRWGREFRFPKFRSMVVDAEALRGQLVRENQHGDGVTFKMKRDPRITWIGRIIRRLSIDELPQLWCVLCGDMSLVGPRPPLPK